jgi:hypothetical protein
MPFTVLIWLNGFNGEDDFEAALGVRVHTPQNLDRVHVQNRASCSGGARFSPRSKLCASADRKRGYGYVGLSNRRRLRQDRVQATCAARLDGSRI